MEEEPTYPPRTVTCHTSGCGNEGAEITVDDDGSAVICGPCGAVIAEATTGGAS